MEEAACRREGAPDGAVLLADAASSTHAWSPDEEGAPGGPFPTLVRNDVAVRFALCDAGPRAAEDVAMPDLDAGLSPGAARAPPVPR